MIKPFTASIVVATLVLSVSGFATPEAPSENTESATRSISRLADDPETMPATIYDLSQLTATIGLTGPTFALEEGVRREISFTGTDSADLFITYTSTAAGSLREKSFAIEVPGAGQDLPYRTVILRVNEGTLAPGGVLVFLRADEANATIQFTSLSAVDSLVPTIR